MDDATLSAFRLLLYELAKNGSLPESSLAALTQSWKDSAQAFFDSGDDRSGESLMELSTTAQGLQMLMKAGSGVSGSAPDQPDDVARLP